ncbi:NADH dehydrogenase [Methanoculleus taiwanensis]|uniref:NADH dehydrogenase n=1 Tax=Methanoculleus taiwanensis TaxID=1550565 RepID=A0A498H3W4_9EURY|nr:nitroreductase family protein [Methanoculleus taiwanensis]RXE57463.1 NADH dehydrogenase [Methanoculleus taiwanensis]
MSTPDTIRRRRSIRKYTDEPVSRETVRELLAAAMSAPSTANEQPWQFIVIDDPGVLANIPTVGPFIREGADAPVAVLVCGDLSMLRMPGFWVQDCSAATENLLVAAHERGLGAVWTAVYPIEDRMLGFRNLFSLPDTVIPFALVPIGYPAETPPAEDRFRDDRIHYNGW